MILSFFMFRVFGPAISIRLTLLRVNLSQFPVMDYKPI
jgi:hypothetical protein